MRNIGTLLAAVLFALPAYAGGDASDGHTHAPAAPLAAVAPLAPRTVVASEEFELVGVLEGTNLMLYLDRFATNAPVAKARIEIESGGFKGVASEIGPAVYSLSAAALARPGKHPLAISIEAGETADLLSATLEVGPSGARAEHVHGRSEWAVWGGSAVLLLLAAGLIALRRRKRAAHRRAGGA